MALDLEGDLTFGLDEAEGMAKANRTGGGYVKVNWLRLEDKGKIILRFLEDFWPVVLQHGGVPTKPAFPGATEAQQQRWPDKMGAVCRKTPKFEKYFPQGCVICEMTGNPSSTNGRYNAGPRLWVRAVERQEVRVETDADVKEYGEPKGTLVGIRDVEDEVDEIGPDGKATGNKVWRKRIIVINQGAKNFFSALKGYQDVWGTITDRDYVVTRLGTGLKTDYQIISLDPVRREDNSVVKMTDPEVINGESTGRTLAEVYLEFAPRLAALIEDQADDTHYDKFFDPSRTYVPPKREDKDEEKPAGSGKASSGSARSTAATTEPDPAARRETTDKLAAIRDSVRKRVQGDSPGQESSTDAPDSAEPVGASGGRGMRNL